MNIVNYVQAWVKSGRVVLGKRMPVDRIVCKDGFSFSVQASSSHYSTPRNDEADAYTHFEVGFPSILEESLAPYAETPDTTDTVFGWVPLRVSVYLIEKHGGVE
jgi:hypothetical protein